MATNDKIKSCALALAEQLFSAWASSPSDERAFFLFEAINIANIVLGSGRKEPDKNVRQYVYDKLEQLSQDLYDFEFQHTVTPYLHEAQLCVVLLSLLKKGW